MLGEDKLLKLNNLRRRRSVDYRATFRPSEIIIRMLKEFELSARPPVSPSKMGKAREKKNRIESLKYFSPFKILIVFHFLPDKKKKKKKKGKKKMGEFFFLNNNLDYGGGIAGPGP